MDNTIDNTEAPKENKFKKYGIIALVILFLIMFLGNVFLINKVMNQDAKFERYENAITALNDSVHHTVKNGMDVYSQKTPEIVLSELVKSEYFKGLSQDQQNFYNDLNKIKGLISATKVQLEKQGHILDSLNTGVVETDSTGKKSIKFDYNDTLQYAQKDTANLFQWKANIIMKKPVVLDFKYDYKPTIQTTFERQKDKSIVVNYQINDPELKVNKMQNFTIPVETDTRGPLKRWLAKNKVPITITAGTLVFLGGAYTGLSLVK